ncbi:hypothetical protein CPB83DRAFT_841540 [Crepidotus variabilis]|uniref:Tetraspanin Tsp2 family n=1 Tax=Crepidotus variabilis TaxID=179855 RepID=A0A9P6EUU5_9AGAR|nr:hypothetical protein CPB83DRAFT_841540 [Crepidotus variabilis]
MDAGTSSRGSIISRANSTYSQTGSTQHMLREQKSSSTDFFTPKTPYSRSKESSGQGTALSLSLNYVPSKFSGSILSGGSRLRAGKGLPLKRGGGVDAFRANESRLASGSRRLKWNKFEWILIFTNSLFTIYSLAGLVLCLLTWFETWQSADVVRVGNTSELVLSTAASCVGIVTSLIGWAGILLNNRGFLAWYTLLSWATFAFLVIPGYMTYKRRTFDLEGKVNFQWSQQLGAEGRLRNQNQLECCGYFSPFVEATISQTCYARSILPGCKLPYMQFERKVLQRWYTAIFILVPVHIVVMLAGLLCSNHITYRFGKGMMPEAYRLNMNTMAVIMENYASQLAEQYGEDIANDILKRSRSNLNLDSTMR